MENSRGRSIIIVSSMRVERTESGMPTAKRPSRVVGEFTSQTKSTQGAIECQGERLARRRHRQNSLDRP
ncbi:hypothetical protein Plhal703r1_c02g0010261 [Plasmopara halstedii]